MLGEERRAEHQGALTEPASGRLVSPDIRDEFGLETIDMNMGPQHPAMHGLLALDGRLHPHAPPAQVQ